MPRLSDRPKAAESPPAEPEGQGVLEPPPEAAKPARAKRSPAVAKMATATATPSTRTSPPTRDVDELGFVELDDTIDYLKVLMYGREGTAKTTGAVSAANVASDGRILVINAEGGLKKVALQRRGIDTSRIVVWPAPESGVQITAKTLERLHERVLANLAEAPGSWFAVVVDSITDIHQALRVQATEKRIAKLRADSKVADALIDEDFVDRDDYGVMTNQLRDWLRDMRDLPCHVVFTALERLDEKTGMLGPAVTPALATDLLGYVDITMYMRATLHATGEDDGDELAEFRALTRPGKATRAKDRFDLLPRVLAEPTFERVLGYIRGDLDEAEDPIQGAYVERRRQEAEARAAAEQEKEARKAAVRKGGARASKTKAADAAEGAPENEE